VAVVSNHIAGSIVIILTTDGVDIDSVVAVRLALKDIVAKVGVAAPNPDEITSSQGLPIMVDYPLPLNEAFEFDAVFVPQSLGIDALCSDSQALKFIQNAYEAQKVIACSGNGFELIQTAASLNESPDRELMLKSVINYSNIGNDFFQLLVDALKARH